MTWIKPIYFDRPDYANNQPNIYYKGSYTKIPFGEYRGVLLKDVPDDYLKWGIDNFEYKLLVEIFKFEVERRIKFTTKKKKVHRRI